MRAGREWKIAHDLFLAMPKTVDFRDATVVTLYLGADGNLKLAGRLHMNFDAGAHLVSRNYEIYGWP